MREDRSTINDRLFAWNGLADTFGILNSSDLQYGSTDFPVVISPPLSTCGGLGAAIHSVPCVDEQGDTVAMVVNDRTIRLYIVPKRNEDDETTIEAHSIDHELDEGYGNPFSELTTLLISKDVSSLLALVVLSRLAPKKRWLRMSRGAELSCLTSIRSLAVNKVRPSASPLARMPPNL